MSNVSIFRKAVTEKLGYTAIVYNDKLADGRRSVKIDGFCFKQKKNARRKAVKLIKKVPFPVTFRVIEFRTPYGRTRYTPRFYMEAK